MLIMKNYNLLMFLGITIAAVSCDIGDYDEAVRRGNDYVDKLLHDIVTEHGSEYDPYVIEDSVIGFQKKVIFVNITGEASLHSGFIRGLATLNRADGCHLKEQGQRLQIRADLGAGVLDMEYSGTAKFMNFGPTITVHGEVDYVEVNMGISVNAADGHDGSLEEFHIDAIKGMRVWVTGLGPLNWAVNTMIKALTTVFSGFIHRGIESQIGNYVSNRLPNYQFPVESVTTVADIATESTTEGPSS